MFTFSPRNRCRQPVGVRVQIRTKPVRRNLSREGSNKGENAVVRNAPSPLRYGLAGNSEHGPYGMGSAEFLNDVHAKEGKPCLPRCQVMLSVKD